MSPDTLPALELWGRQVAAPWLVSPLLCQEFCRLEGVTTYTLLFKVSTSQVHAHGLWCGPGAEALAPGSTGTTDPNPVISGPFSALGSPPSDAGSVLSWDMEGCVFYTAQKSKLRQLASAC